LPATPQTPSATTYPIVGIIQATVVPPAQGRSSESSTLRG